MTLRLPARAELGGGLGGVAVVPPGVAGQQAGPMGSWEVARAGGRGNGH